VTLDSVFLLILIIIANGAPVILRALLGSRFSWPIDFGFRLPDNEPVFGKAKTWRGLAVALPVTAVAAALFGYSLETGALVALYALGGDLLSSFIKRRLRMAPHSMAPLLDQVPESLLPAVMLRDIFELTIESIIILVCAFIIAELVLSYIFYKLGIRKKPY